MTNKNNLTIQTFNHLRYYPNSTIDSKVYRIIEGLNLDKEVAITYFLYRLNFFLSVTEQKISFIDFNNKKVMTKILSDFHSFLFGKDNYFQDSDSGRNRYNKVFNQLEKTLNIKIIRGGGFDYSEVNMTTLDFFKGWFISNEKQQIFLDFISFHKTFGKETTDDYLKKINLFILSKGLKSFSNSRVLISKLLNYLSEKKDLAISHDDIVILMKNYFYHHQEKGHEINGKKQEWNWFINLCHFVFNLAGHEQYILFKTNNYDSHIKTKSGKQYKTKLITEIPLEIFDNEAFDILFKKINQDVELINKWANFTINYHYQKFLNVKDEFKVKSDYYNKNTADVAMIKFGKYDRINQEDIYDKDSYLNRNVLFAIGVKLVLNHPEITDSFINNCLYLDEKDNVVGINNTDQGTYLVGYKLRRGNALAQQKILLNKESQRLISILLKMSSDIRKNLKEDNNSLYRKLFISASVNNLLISDFPQQSFMINKEPHSNIINYLQEHQNISYDDSVHLARNTTLTKIRASRGVQIYFETQSTTKMAKALGHVKYDPQLLSRYLPSPILDFFQRRWILLFQKGIICEAMKNSNFLLRASNFKNMEQLNKFLENHTLKNIPNVEKQDSANQQDDLKVYISIDEDKIAALLSIGKAIENSKEMNKVSSKAIYWKQLGEEIVKEINNNHSYSQYRSIVANAKRKVEAKLFEKVIYE